MHDAAPDVRVASCTPARAKAKENIHESVKKNPPH
jgi:hypothetical protein